MNTFFVIKTCAACRQWAALLTLSLLAGCATSPAPSLYMLDLPFGRHLAGIEKGVAVGIGPIEFPQYLDRPQIITRDGATRLSASDAHVWAEPLKDSASRVLVVSVAEKLDSNRIYRAPRRTRTPLDWRAQIDIGRFDGALGGEVLLATRWSLYRGENKEPTVTRVSIVEEPVLGEDFEALVAAQTRALARLAHEIAAAIVDEGR